MKGKISLLCVYSLFFSRLQIVSASVDELTCRFVDHGGRKHVIHATLTETYPNTPPVWFSESEDPKVSEAVSRLASTSGLDNHMMYQIKLLLTTLCDLFSIPSMTRLMILGGENPQ